MNLKAVDWVALSTYVVGGGLSGVCAFAAIVDPKHAAIYAAGGGMLISVAGIIRIIANKTGAPASAIVEGAPVVPADTTVVHADTPVIATNVTTPKNT